MDTFTALYYTALYAFVALGIGYFIAKVRERE